MAAFRAEHLEVQIVEKAGERGKTLAFLRLKNQGDTTLDRNWRLYYSLGLTPVESEHRVSATLIEGRYGYVSAGEKWQPLAPGKTILIEIEGWLFDRMPDRARQGFHLTTWSGGENEAAPQTPGVVPPALLPLDTLQNRWIRDISPSCDTRPVTPALTWEKNQRSHPSTEAAVIPHPRSLTPLGGTLIVPGFTFDDPELAKVLEAYRHMDGIKILVTLEEQIAPEAYTIDIGDDSIGIKASTPAGIYYSAQTLRCLIHHTDDGLTLKKCQITDSPDLQHRGAFIDTARHFQSADELKPVIRAMAACKMNRLQLGISNDEGWRIEIEGLPELTEVGARRTFFANDDAGRPRGLYPAWGDGPEEAVEFISAAAFIDLLKFAAAHHVTIVPEFNLPAHANALIRSMQASGRYCIVDVNDKSSHKSAQGYTNNVVNVCLPDTYRLAREVIETIASYFKAADVAFTNIHLGGDEVPHGAWMHSPVCQNSSAWLENCDQEKPDDAVRLTQSLLSYYAEQMQALLSEISPETRALFWHEMSPSLPKSMNSAITGWTTETGDRHLIDDVLGRDQQLIIANASFLYLDMPYALHADEPGLPWAAYIDEALIYDFDPLDCWKIDTNQARQVLGLQAQLWSETVTSAIKMGYYLFPRLLAVAERAWNINPNPENWPAFAAALGQRDIPYLETLGLNFRLPPPGVIVRAGVLEANVTFPGLVVRYSDNGQDPDQDSKIYDQPLSVNAGRQFRLATFTVSGNNKSRVISIDT